MILVDFLKALTQILDPRFLGILLRGVGLSIALLFGFTIGLSWLAGLLLPETVMIPWIGEVTWLDSALSWAVIPVMLVFSVFLMAPVASAFIGLYLDDVADAVEERHYPNAPTVAPVSLIAGLEDTVKFLGILIGANLMALVFYVLMPPLAPLLFWGLNGYLLGREYGQMVALRRLGRDGATAFRRRHILTLWTAGVLMVVPLTIPVVNLVVPILGVATFTHIFHRLHPV